jgi:hypothetical protein
MGCHTTRRDPSTFFAERYGAVLPSTSFERENKRNMTIYNARETSIKAKTTTASKKEKDANHGLEKGYENKEDLTGDRLTWPCREP